MHKLIVFHASWCGPCKAYAKITDELKSQHPEIEFEDYDVDSEDQNVIDLMSEYGIRSVPTSVIITDEGVTKKFGLIPKNELEQLLKV